MLSTCNELSKLIGADGVIILGKAYFLNNRLIFRGFFAWVKWYDYFGQVSNLSNLKI